MAETTMCITPCSAKAYVVFKTSRQLCVAGKAASAVARTKRLAVQVRVNQQSQWHGQLIFRDYIPQGRLRTGLSILISCGLADKRGALHLIYQWNAGTTGAPRTNVRMWGFRHYNTNRPSMHCSRPVIPSLLHLLHLMHNEGPVFNEHCRQCWFES